MEESWASVELCEAGIGVNGSDVAATVQLDLGPGGRTGVRGREGEVVGVEGDDEREMS